MDATAKLKITKLLEFNRQSAILKDISAEFDTQYNIDSDLATKITNFQKTGTDDIVDSTTKEAQLRTGVHSLSEKSYNSAVGAAASILSQAVSLRSELTPLQSTANTDRTDYLSKKAAYKIELDKTVAQQKIVDDLQVVLKAKILACKGNLYDEYKTTYINAQAQRVTDLATIKTQLETKEKAQPVTGATGSRCDKPLSGG